MSTYVLVHGSHTGGWIWKHVAERLQRAGHVAYHPSLDGAAERSDALRPEITLDSQGHEIAQLLFYEDLTDVILVGTSTGGMVVARAAEEARDRVGRLIFIDALVPLPGELVATINSRPRRDQSDLAYGPSFEEAQSQSFANVPPELQQWARARYTRHPRLPVDEPVDLARFWSQPWVVDVLRCTQGTHPPEVHQRRTAERLQGTYTEIDSGHYVMLSRIDELTAYLLDRA